MKTLIRMENFTDDYKDLIGGKGYALSQMNRFNIPVPKTFCVPCTVYDAYLEKTRIGDRILLEINRKPFNSLRWEEIWDISLRIRSLFLNTPIPEKIRNSLVQSIDTHNISYPVAIRSSAPGEDDIHTSFAGIHESYLNISGSDSIIKHIKLVWASLYSDAALLYRKELSLDIQTSSMAVLIQELIFSDRSGVFFGVHPSHSDQAVLESVYGLNQGLVDGDIDPDQWFLDRETGDILKHHIPERTHFMIPDKQGVLIKHLPENKVSKPPLDQKNIRQIWNMATKIESLYHSPQDIEWCFTGNDLTILQSRPITVSQSHDSDDKRAWYLSLHRSYENLNTLYDRIENHLIPDMIDQARELGQTDLSIMTDSKLADEIQYRQKIYDKWVKIYWTDFIPFAHGIRLFGQVYNDAVKPEDPFEFMLLLEKTNLKSMERNRCLEQLAAYIQDDSYLKIQLQTGDEPETNHPFMILLDDFILRFGDLACQTTGSIECNHGHEPIIRILLQYSEVTHPDFRLKKETDIKKLQKKYLDCFPHENKKYAQDILNLGRESYRLRDDDNIHLGRIESHLSEAIREGQKRILHPSANHDELEKLICIPSLSQTDSKSPGVILKTYKKDETSLLHIARQVTGQPAGPGISKGSARVILKQEDLMLFKQGEVLVCKGVDPTMTFVVPLAAAIIEERGGMLIHGAIIAREYGLPCVTGVHNITKLIETGDQVTVDGYLGIVTCSGNMVFE